LVFEVNGGKTRVQIEKIMDDFHVRSPLEGADPAPDGTVRATFRCRLPRRHHCELLNELAGLSQVRRLTELERKEARHD